MQPVNQSQLLQLTKDLIRFKSITPDDAGCMEYLQTYLQNNGFTIVRVDRNDTKNLIARIGNSDNIFAFAGHIDVVPPGNTSLWKNQDPFTLYEEDGRLYGRGISDMKGGVSAFIHAAIMYLKQYPPVNYSLMLLITSDEEGVATDGTVAIVEYLKAHKIQPKYTILGEPTCVNELGDTIKVGRRGSLNGHLSLRGVQGHIAYPDLAKNPIHLFAGAMNKLIQTKWDEGCEFFPPSSFQFSNISSGLGIDNVTPGVLYANFNFRYNNLHTEESLTKQVMQILDDYGLDYKIEWRNSAKPFLSKKGRLFNVITQLTLQLFNCKTCAKTDGGTSDGRFLIDICDEIIELGLVNKTIHQVNENILHEDLNKLSTLYYYILDHLFHD